ncbi:autophagy-related protein 13a-like isoform X2 [Impatiens glandulifera]|uniref:autophagy-related protein 13a-like isoform X2 n=1 Tax=Impatiens glandulifera TaxID=253017 RepID=UPI001FB0AA62|nr:autophagy-related protein 13a-like isoform X2 [Impatiens glandulifera]
MDLQYNSSADHGRFEQIVSQFLIKSLHMILDSRIPSVHHHNGEYFSSIPSKKSNRWFNLLLGDRPPVLDNLSFWHRNLVQPMIIDIILVQEMTDSSSRSNHTLSAAFESGKSVETLLERWTVQYEYSKSMFHQFGVESSSSSYKKMYKKLIILLRTLYSTMRMLPAYRPFRKLSSKSVETCDFDINYKVSSFGSPLSKEQENSMKPCNFSADSAHGRLSVSVTYRESLSGLNLETSTSFPPQIIVDYAVSPAADPFRAFPSRSPSSAQSQPHRPHSWTSGRTAPVYKNIGFDDYQLSPPFSPSPSSYSPNHLLNNDNFTKTRQLSETAPVSITHQMMGRSPKYQSHNLSDPNRHQLPPPSPKNTRMDSSSHDSSPLGIIRTSRKSESSKVLKDGKDDSGRFSGVLSSSGSPHFGFSGSSSRFSLQDDLDDVFSCPFIVDDVDPPPVRYYKSSHMLNIL